MWRFSISKRQKQLDYELYQNTPNPFNAKTTIGFNLPENTDIKLKIRDIDGRLIQLIEGHYEKGMHQITIDRHDLPVSGVLYYTLETEDYVSTRKMILIALE